MADAAVAEPSLRSAARRRAGPLKTSIVALALVAGASACVGLMGGQGDPSAPLLVTGKVLDTDGKPMGGATLQVVVNDYSAAINVGDQVPQVFQTSFTTNLDGSFEIHLAPTPALLAFGAKEGGFVNFNLYALGPNGFIAPWAFPRELTDGTWSDPVPSVELRPIKR